MPEMAEEKADEAQIQEIQEDIDDTFKTVHDDINALDEADMLLSGFMDEDGDQGSDVQEKEADDNDGQLGNTMNDEIV